MSSCVVWSIPSEVIENAISTSLKLDTTPTVWGSGFDDVAGCVNIIIEIDDSDLESLGLNMGDMECHVLEDGELLQ